ncbi:MAG: hypothetical protein H8Z69_05865 [Nanohaloarchaea archaeon]|nr:hypothetical protein [Candidatus Nanohaloarchaea archaeon]
MSGLEVVEQMLGEEKAENLKEARKHHADITEEERKRIRNTNRALEYTTETIEDPERDFEISTAMILWGGNTPEELSSLFSRERVVDAMVNDMQEVREGNYNKVDWKGSELLESFRHHVTTNNHPANKMIDIEDENDYDSNLSSLREDIKSWFKETRENFHKMHNENGLLRDFDPKNIGDRPEMRETAKEAYDSREPEVPEVSKPVATEILKFLVEDRIYLSPPEENSKAVREDEKREKTFETKHSRIDWDGFKEKYSSVPGDEMRELYEIAAKYQDEDGIIDSDLLGKITADINGMDVKYDADEKDLAENFGELKRAVSQVEDLDYGLPVGGKERELEALARTIQNVQEFYEKETYKIKREA